VVLGQRLRVRPAVCVRTSAGSLSGCVHTVLRQWPATPTTTSPTRRAATNHTRPQRPHNPGEELTYDYRFAGEEKLRCNCGAPNCRGWVNTPGSHQSPARGADGSIWAPRRELEAVPGAPGPAAGPAAGGKKRLQL
jgi:hypothetical protein